MDFHACLSFQVPATPSECDSDSVAEYRSPSPFWHGYDVTAEDRSELRDYNAAAENDKSMTVKIQDAHDGNGEGMLFEIKYTTQFKHVFDAFKAASCKKCRDATAIRFKYKEIRVKNSDSPSSLKIRSVKSISIRAFSNRPGLCCPACQKTGYPSTHGVTLNGNQRVSSGFDKQNRKLTIRILFQDPNGKITPLSVNRFYRFRTAKANYAKQIECDAKMLHFFFEGEAVTDEDTAEEMGMKNNSLVEVNMHMMGA